MDAALEVVYTVATLTYAFLLLQAFLFRDGVVWTIWRWSVVAEFLGIAAATLVIFVADMDALGDLRLISVALGVMGVARLGGVLMNMMLAIHISRLLTSGDAPASRPRRVIGDDEEEGA